MLRTCAFANCYTVTLGTYCLEHERLIRASIEAEAAIAEEPLTRELAALDQQAAPTEPPELPAP